jgi:hypothetical protein
VAGGSGCLGSWARAVSRWPGGVAVAVAGWVWAAVAVAGWAWAAVAVAVAGCGSAAGAWGLGAWVGADDRTGGGRGAAVAGGGRLRPGRLGGAAQLGAWEAMARWRRWDLGVGEWSGC